MTSRSLKEEREKNYCTHGRPPRKPARSSEPKKRGSFGPVAQYQNITQEHEENLVTFF